jgi:hypothetical protein
MCGGWVAGEQASERASERSQESYRYIIMFNLLNKAPNMPPMAPSACACQQRNVLHDSKTITRARSTRARTHTYRDRDRDRDMDIDNDVRHRNANKSTTAYDEEENLVNDERGPAGHRKVSEREHSRRRHVTPAGAWCNPQTRYKRVINQSIKNNDNKKYEKVIHTLEMK